MSDPDFIRKVVGDAEKDLGLPDGFLWTLMEEDDWSFVIKGHSLLEASINQILSDSLSRPQLDKVIESLALGGRRTGKLAFVFELELLSPEMFRFVVEFARLRNTVIHRVENVTFTFARYVASLSKDQQNVFVDWARCGETADVGSGESVLSRRDWILQQPKRAVSVVLVMLLAYIHSKKTSRSAFAALLPEAAKPGLKPIRRKDEPGV